MGLKVQSIQTYNLRNDFTFCCFRYSDKSGSEPTVIREIVYVYPDQTSASTSTTTTTTTSSTMTTSATETAIRLSDKDEKKPPPLDDEFEEQIIPTIP